LQIVRIKIILDNMMNAKMLKKIVLIAAFVSVSTGVFAQSFWQRPSYSVYLGGTCPIGTFGRTNITDAGSGVDFINNNWVLANQGGMKASAKLGFGIGFKATLPFEEMGIRFGNNNAMPLTRLGQVGRVFTLFKYNFIATLDVFYNGVHSVAERNLFQAMLSHHVHYLSDRNMRPDINDITLEFSPSYQMYYLNIPIMVGVNAVYDYNSDWSFWGETAIGLDVRKISDIKDFKYEARLNDLTLHGDNHVQTFSTTEGTIKFDWSVAFACQVGVGATWQKRWSAGLHYYFLGKAKVYGEKDYTFYDPQEYGNYPVRLDYKKEDRTYSRFNIPTKLSQNMLVLRLGYNF